MQEHVMGIVTDVSDDGFVINDKDYIFAPDHLDMARIGLAVKITIENDEIVRALYDNTPIGETINKLIPHVQDEEQEGIVLDWIYEYKYWHLPEVSIAILVHHMENLPTGIGMIYSPSVSEVESFAEDVWFVEVNNYRQTDPGEEGRYDDDDDTFMTIKFKDGVYVAVFHCQTGKMVPDSYQGFDPVIVPFKKLTPVVDQSNGLSPKTLALLKATTTDLDDGEDIPF